MNTAETYELFESIADSYGVCDMATQDGVHYRVRMGKKGKEKARFLACSRDGWMCLYYDYKDRGWINSICGNETAVVNDESYDFRCRVEPEQFNALITKTAEILGVKKPIRISEGEIHIDKASLEKYMIGFREALTQRGESVNFYNNSVFVEQEGYKNRIIVEATECLKLIDWSQTIIGDGKISSQVIKAINKADNLINQYPIMHFKNICEAKPVEAEHALYDLYCGNDDEKSFVEITDIFGDKYGLIAYLFFIHDPKRYLPISPQNFDERFKKLGIDFQTSFRCSWDNYTGFINIIATIQNHLQSFLGVPVTLLDAHSFVWMMQYVDGFLTTTAAKKEVTAPVQRDTTATISVRIGQSQYRKNLLDYWGNACSVTGCASTELLVASHIKPWRDCHENNEWIDTFNGLLLTPNLDTAFDYGYITFNDDGSIVISSRLSKEARKSLGINEHLRLRKITDQHREYLKYHRQNVFDNM